MGKHVGADAEINLVKVLTGGDIRQVDITTDNLICMAELMRQYRGFPLGVAEASVITTTDRLEADEVAAFDHRTSAR